MEYTNINLYMMGYIDISNCRYFHPNIFNGKSLHLRE